MSLAILIHSVRSFFDSRPSPSLIETGVFRMEFRERGRPATSSVESVRAKQNRVPFGIRPHPGPLGAVKRHGGGERPESRNQKERTE
jgi:hypothetical protein